MKEKSYSEFMKAKAMKQKNQPETFVLDLYIDMLLSEIQLNAEKAHLHTLIDKAIDEQNKEKFLELSNQYIRLSKKFGT